MGLSVAADSSFQPAFFSTGEQVRCKYNTLVARTLPSLPTAPERSRRSKPEHHRGRPWGGLIGTNGAALNLRKTRGSATDVIRFFSFGVGLLQQVEEVDFATHTRWSSQNGSAPSSPLLPHLSTKEELEFQYIPYKGFSTLPRKPPLYASCPRQSATLGRPLPVVFPSWPKNAFDGVTSPTECLTCLVE